MNIFRLQLMVELLKEMEVAIPVFEVTGMACDDDDEDEEVEVTRVIEAFDLDDWTNAIGQYCDSDRPDCGYSACAVGHAMFDHRFNALGLVNHKGAPSYQGETDWDAVEKFFDISGSTAWKLFSPNSYDEDVTPKDVAAQVQKLINVGENDFAEIYD